jgi:hypothetical protein
MFPEFEDTVEFDSNQAPWDEAAFPVRVIAPVFVITDPVVTVRPPAVLASVPAIMETSPPVDSIRAARVALALPLIVMFPLATIGPVGLTVVPPEILMVPEDAVREPAPA